MSRYISQIAFKLLIISLCAMSVLTGYFIISTYRSAIAHTETLELTRLQGVVKTLALQLEAPQSYPSPSENPTAQDESQNRAYILSQLIFNIKTFNKLDGKVTVLVINRNDGQASLIGPHGLIPTEKAGANLNHLLENKPFEPSRFGLSDSKEPKTLFYSYPLSLPFSDDLSGYVSAETNIDDQLKAIAKELYLNLGLALAAFIFVGFIAYRLLRRILFMEVRSRKKLKEYTRLANLRKAELETLSFVISKSDNLVLLTDQSGKIEWLNESYTRKNNYSNKELSGFVGRELAEVSHYPKIQEVIDRVMESREKVQYEAKSYDADGNEFWASTTVTPILSDDGKVEKLLFIDADITRLKIAENEIAKMANFAQENSKPLIRIEQSGKVIFANEAGESLLTHWGTKLNQRIKKAQLRDAVCAVYETGFEKSINIEHDNRIFNLRFFPVAEKGYVNVYGEDITEVKQAEKRSVERTLALEQHNLNITDSINYARRIQEALMPGEDQVRKYFKDSFLISKPKDIVSGDFLWCYELRPKKEYLLALADCTGHGVPGAMMSIIGHSLLNEIVEAHGETDPAAILEKLNVEVIKSLKQKTKSDSKDGMDVGIVRVNLVERTVIFAGAYQHLFWMNGSLNTVKGDRHPIGGLHHDENRKFNNQTIKVSKGDSIYLCSDGFTDQFGGPENKKFMTKRFVDLISANHKYSMQAQSNRYEKTFEQWKGNTDQVDDVSLLGIKF